MIHGEKFATNELLCISAILVYYVYHLNVKQTVQNLHFQYRIIRIVTFRLYM